MCCLYHFFFQIQASNQNDILNNYLYEFKQKCGNQQYQDITPTTTINEGMTFAMYLAYNKVIPPKEWYHDPSLRCIVQKQTQTSSYGRYNTFGVSNSQFQNFNGSTVAMIYAQQGIIPPKDWEHQPEIQNNNGDTVAMLLAKNNKPIPKQWEHNPKSQNNNRQTVATILLQQRLQVPVVWQYNPLDLLYYYNSGNNKINLVQYMYGTQDNMILPSWQVGTQTQDEQNKTVAMYLAQKKIPAPPYFYHNPELQDNYGNTVAMIFANQGLIPPKEWHHNPNLMNKRNYTVYIILYQKNIIPPKEWEHQQFQFNFKISNPFDQFQYQGHNSIKQKEIQQQTIQQKNEQQQELQTSTKQEEVKQQQDKQQTQQQENQQIQQQEKQKEEQKQIQNNDQQNKQPDQKEQNQQQQANDNQQQTDNKIKEQIENKQIEECIEDEQIVDYMIEEISYQVGQQINDNKTIQQLNNKIDKLNQKIDQMSDIINKIWNQMQTKQPENNQQQNNQQQNKQPENKQQQSPSGFNFNFNQQPQFGFNPVKFGNQQSPQQFTFQPIQTNK